MTSLPTSASHDYNYYYEPPPQARHYQQHVQPPRKKKQQQQHNNNGDEEASNKSMSHSNSRADDVLPSVQMLEILMRENSNLRAELANARMRIQTIHKVQQSKIKIYSG